MSESALVAVSWSLIPLLVFGVSGMVFGRNSLARPALLTVASLFLLCAFYLAIWLRL